MTIPRVASADGRDDGTHRDPSTVRGLVGGARPAHRAPPADPAGTLPPVGTECQRDYGDAVVEGETLAGPPLDDLTDIGPLTLGGLLVDRCTRFADHEALVFDDPLHG